MRCDHRLLITDYTDNRYMTALPRPLLLSLCGVLLLIADQILKYLARSNPTFTHYLIKPYLGWEYFGNPGVAFSLPIPNAVLVIATPLIILGLALWLIKKQKDQIFSLGLILIIAGAVSNFIDRVIFGITIDYLRLLTGVLNLADIVIVTGAILLIVSAQKLKRS